MLSAKHYGCEGAASTAGMSPHLYAESDLAWCKRRLPVEVPLVDEDSCSALAGLAKLRASLVFIAAVGRCRCLWCFDGNVTARIAYY